MLSKIHSKAPPAMGCSRPRSARANQRPHALSASFLAKVLPRSRAAGELPTVGQPSASQNGFDLSQYHIITVKEETLDDPFIS